MKARAQGLPQRIELGRYIVADSKIIAEAIAIAGMVEKHEPFKGFHVGARRKSARKQAALAA